MIKMPSGVPINKVRVFAPNATNAQTLRSHAVTSKKDYKNTYYVTSAEGSNFRLALFSNNGKLSVEPDNSLAWAQNHKRIDYTPLDAKPGFMGYIMPGSMALTFHAGHPEELESMNIAEISKRLYKVVKFESSGRTTFRLHTEARAATILSDSLKAIGKSKTGDSTISFDNPGLLLYLSSGKFLKQMLFEGIHFKMNLDGTIVFLKR